LPNAHSELYGTAKEFSVQQIVSCAPNPQECGGKGGCDGATAELALDHVMEADLMTEKAFPYVASDKACPASVQTKMDSPNLVATANRLTSFGMFGYSSLPTNKLFPLMQAVAEQGPVSVGVAVAPGFNWYFGGIFEDCSTWVINHLVTLIGYGELYGKKYWHIQNSWGAYWGENGFMKLQRLDDVKEEALCGWDYEPEKGLGCKGGPPKVWVCGSCGILLDGVVPHFKLKSQGWYARVGGRKPDM
jgi:cathepsin L